MSQDPQKMSGVVTRFAPSPTGKFHVGSIRTVLYNYLFARKHGGKYILRCEDTDPVRSKKEFEEYFLEVFKWLGLEYDEYYRQSERTEIYKRYLNKLIDEDKAYISKETPKEEGQRSEVIRFRNNGEAVTFHDEVLGDITFDTKELGDFVIARDIESPLYHFTVVVDDHEMGVTHVIRGQDHVSNTPRQILIQRAIGAKQPVYAHASIILNNERAKLSKRDPLVRPSLEYRDEGYLPQAMLNFMALLGWNPGTEQEIFSLHELIESFSLERLQKAGAVFNPEKLEWVSKEHIKRLSLEERSKLLLAYIPERVLMLPGYSKEILDRITPMLVERIGHFGEISEIGNSGELDYFFTSPAYTKEGLFWKDDRDVSKLKERLTQVRTLISNLDENSFTTDDVRSCIWDYAEKEGRGQVLWPLRFALSGREKSTDPFTLASIVGKKETIKRIDTALGML